MFRIINRNIHSRIHPSPRIVYPIQNIYERNFMMKNGSFIDTNVSRLHLEFERKIKCCKKITFNSALNSNQDDLLKYSILDQLKKFVENDGYVVKKIESRDDKVILEIL